MLLTWQFMLKLNSLLTSLLTVVTNIIILLPPFFLLKKLSTKVVHWKRRGGASVKVTIPTKVIRPVAHKPKYV